MSSDSTGMSNTPNLSARQRRGQQKGTPTPVPEDEYPTVRARNSVDDVLADPTTLACGYLSHLVHKKKDLMLQLFKCFSKVEDLANFGDFVVRSTRTLPGLRVDEEKLEKLLDCEMRDIAKAFNECSNDVRPITPFTDLKECYDMAAFSKVKSVHDGVIAITVGTSEVALNCHSEEAMYDSIVRALKVNSQFDITKGYKFYGYDNTAKNLSFMINTFYEPVLNGVLVDFKPKDVGYHPFTQVTRCTEQMTKYFYDVSLQIAKAVVDKIRNVRSPTPKLDNPLSVVYCVLYDCGFRENDVTKHVQLLSGWRKIVDRFGKIFSPMETDIDDPFLDLLDEDAKTKADVTFTLTKSYINVRAEWKEEVGRFIDAAESVCTPVAIAPLSLSQYGKVSRLRAVVEPLMRTPGLYQCIRLYGNAVHRTAEQLLQLTKFNNDVKLPKILEMKQVGEKRHLDAWANVEALHTDFQGTTLLVQFSSEENQAGGGDDEKFVNYITSCVNKLRDAKFTGTWLVPHNLCSENIFLQVFYALAEHFKTIRCVTHRRLCNDYYYWVASTEDSGKTQKVQYEDAKTFREDLMFQWVRNTEGIDMGCMVGRIAPMIPSAEEVNSVAQYFACFLHDKVRNRSVVKRARKATVTFKSEQLTEFYDSVTNNARERRKRANTASTNSSGKQTQEKAPTHGGESMDEDDFTHLSDSGDNNNNINNNNLGGFQQTTRPQNMDQDRNLTSPPSSPFRNSATGGESQSSFKYIAQNGPGFATKAELLQYLEAEVTRLTKENAAWEEYYKQQSGQLSDDEKVRFGRVQVSLRSRRAEYELVFAGA